MASNITDPDFAAALQMAIKSKNIKEIEKIVNSICYPCQSFYECVFAACSQGHNDIIDVLLQCKNIDINKKLYYENILSGRQMRSKIKFVKQEKTALLLAAECGQLVTIKLLEKYHADIKERTSQGNTALILAAKNNHLNVVKYLVEAKGMDVNEENTYKDNALTCAANNAALECIKYLINKGANVLHTEMNGKSVLYNAVFSGSLDCVKAVAESIPKEVLNEHINHGTVEYNLTTLHWAAKLDSVEMVEYLLSKGADPGLKTKWRAKPFHLAKSPKVKRLLIKGAWVKVVKPSEMD